MEYQPGAMTCCAPSSVRDIHPALMLNLDDVLDMHRMPSGIAVSRSAWGTDSTMNPDPSSTAGIDTSMVSHLQPNIPQPVSSIGRGGTSHRFFWNRRVGECERQRIGIIQRLHPRAFASSFDSSRLARPCSCIESRSSGSSCRHRSHRTGEEPFAHLGPHERTQVVMLPVLHAQPRRCTSTTIFLVLPVRGTGLSGHQPRRIRSASTHVDYMDRDLLALLERRGLQLGHARQPERHPTCPM